jgi:hypothetical protein
MPSFVQSDPGYKHAIEFFMTRFRRFFPTRQMADLAYDPLGPESHFWRQKNLGNIVEIQDKSFYGSGAPSLTTVPDGGRAGEFYFRSDTPGTANQRIYVCTVSGTTNATTGVSTLGTWVGIL